MKCPHCKESLGINNVCINPTCSYFGNEITNSTINNTNDNSNDNSATIPNDKSKTKTNNTYNNTINENYNLPNDNFNDSNSNNTYQKSTYSTGTSSNNTLNKSRLGPNINDISDEEFLAFFGEKNAEFYLRQASTYRLNTKFTNWNWASFFLTFYWLLYRKLYGMAFAYLAIDLVTAFLAPASLIIRIVLGFYGNNIYLKTAEKKIRAIRLLQNNISREEYLMKIREQGGTNIIAPLAFIIVITIIIVLIIVLGAVIFSSSSEVHQGYYYY